MNVQLLDPAAYRSPAEFLEWCGRICHDRQDATGEDTPGFLRRILLKARHHSIGEHLHYRVTVRPSGQWSGLLQELLTWLHENLFIPWTRATARDALVLGLNVRHVVELIQQARPTELERGAFGEMAQYLGGVLEAPHWPRATSTTQWAQQFFRSEPGWCWPTEHLHHPEHVVFASFLVEGVSRVTETQAVRHRTLSYLVQSGRRVPSGQEAFVWPAGTIAANEMLGTPGDSEDELVGLPTRDLIRANLWHEYQVQKARGVPQQDARYFLPQGMATRWVVTGSIRWWRRFLAERLNPAAQWEIRQMAGLMADALAERFGANLRDWPPAR